MKKIILITFIITLMLVGCSAPTEEIVNTPRASSDTESTPEVFSTPTVNINIIDNLEGKYNASEVFWDVPKVHYFGITEENLIIIEDFGAASRETIIPRDMIEAISKINTGINETVNIKVVGNPVSMSYLLNIADSDRLNDIQTRK